MKRVSVVLMVVLAGCGPALAGPHRHRTHMVRSSHTREVGFPITTAKDSVRINSVGEVLSDAPPLRSDQTSMPPVNQPAAKP
jgi:hypothetical protein